MATEAQIVKSKRKPKKLQMKTKKILYKKELLLMQE